MKRILSGILIMLLFTVSVSLAETHYGTTAVFGGSSDRVHLRKAAAQSSQSLGLYFSGTEVVCLSDSAQEWVKVRIGTETGYIMSRYLSDEPHPVAFQYGTVTADGWLNLRKSPSQKSVSMAKLYSDETLTIMGETSDHWYYVQAGNQFGYVKAQYVTLTDAAPAFAPSVQLIENHATAYRAVLAQEATLFYTQTAAYAFLSGTDMLSGGRAVDSLEYAVADVDQDARDEVVLRAAGYEGYLVLDAADGKVYGYDVVYRAFLTPKADGTFSFSSSAADNGFGHARMDGNFHIIPLVRSESSADGVLFFRDDNRISQAEYEAALARQEQKPDIVWYRRSEGPLAVPMESKAGWETTGRVHPSLPEFSIQVSDTGLRSEMLQLENHLTVSVSSSEGTCQQLSYRSNVTPATESLAAMAQLKDLNQDGYKDLVLLTAFGARNAFFSFALWDEEAAQFRPVEQACTWDREKGRFHEEPVQLQLCNYSMVKGDNRICTSEQDGYRFRRDIVYEWDARYALEPKAILDVYDAGENLIGETLTLFATGVTVCWDEQYPEEWYYGQEGVAAERLASAEKIMQENAIMDGTLLQVANVDWVHLRKQNSKTSPSLAKLPAGTAVTLLVDDCGGEKGWVRILYRPEDGSAWKTGYIWHRYLEPLN